MPPLACFAVISRKVGRNELTTLFIADLYGCFLMNCLPFDAGVDLVSVTTVELL